MLGSGSVPSTSLWGSSLRATSPSTSCSIVSDPGVGTGPPRFELGPAVPKTAVLPLHYGPFARLKHHARDGPKRIPRLPPRNVVRAHRIVVREVACLPVKPALASTNRVLAVRRAPIRPQGSVRRLESRGTPLRLQRASAADCALHAAPGVHRSPSALSRGEWRRLADPRGRGKMMPPPGSKPGPDRAHPRAKAPGAGFAPNPHVLRSMGLSWPRSPFFASPGPLPAVEPPDPGASWRF